MRDNILNDETTRKEKKFSWQAPELLDLSVINTAGNKDAINPNEGNRGRGGKIEVSPS